MRPYFEFRLDGAGWAEAHISDGLRGLTVTASYLSDAPRDLLDAMQSLYKTRSAHCQWMEEPGSWIWRFARNGNELKVVLGWRDDWPSDPQAPSETRFDITCDFRKFVIRVRDAFRAVLEEWGEEGYERAWHYPFPHEAWNKLDAAIRTDRDIAAEAGNVTPR